MKITFKPYRGKIEPIHNVDVATIKLEDKYIEVITSYEFDELNSDTMTSKRDFYKYLGLIKRENVSSVEIVYYTHEGDPDKEWYPRVIVVGTGGATLHIWLDESNVHDIYSKIKSWMINEDSTS